MTNDKTAEQAACEYATASENQHMLEAPRSNAVLYHSFLAGDANGAARERQRILTSLMFRSDIPPIYTDKLKQIIFGGGE